MHGLSDAGYSLARFARPRSGGQVWQSWLHRYMRAIGASRVQGPGSMGLFGYPSLSGIRHEIDAAGIRDVAVAIEAKDEAGPINKYEVDAWDGRTMDCYRGAVFGGWRDRLYRIMCGTNAVDTYVARYAAIKGIIMVGGDRIPLPSLLAAADRWDATEWLTDSELSDLVTLGERACHPLSVYERGGRFLSTTVLDLWKPADLDDLEYLHSLASDRYLDWLDATDPRHFERICEECLSRVSGWSELQDAPAARPAGYSESSVSPARESGSGLR